MPQLPSQPMLHALMFRRAGRLGFAILLALSFVLSAGAFGARAQSGFIWYVDAVAAGAGTGSSWADAFPTLIDGLGAAGPGDSILVAEGMYKPGDFGGGRDLTFTVDQVSIYGGYPHGGAPFNQSDPVNHPTILSGDLLGNDIPGNPNRPDNVYHVVTLMGNATLSNLTVSGGNADGGGLDSQGGGVVISAAPNVVMANVIIRDNLAQMRGGGMAALFCGLTLSHVSFIGNTSGGVGGGMYNEGGTPQLSDMLFDGNVAGQGGGLYLAGSATTIDGGLFAENHAVNFGGGVYIASNTVTLINVTQTNNAAGAGGGIYNLGHLTLSHFTMDDSNPNTIVDDLGSSLTVENSILWGQEPFLLGTAPIDSINISYSFVKGGWPGEGNLSLDPLLSDLADHGGGLPTFALLPGSMAIDFAGSGCPVYDARGVTRSSPSCDLGAFESQGFSLAKDSGDNQSAYIGVTFAEKLCVEVSSAHSEPVDGGMVNFSAPFSGAGADFSANPVTVSSGLACDEAIANRTAGAYQVMALITGAVPVEFNLTNNVLATYYVKPASSGKGDCTSWAHACYLPTALGRASEGSQVWAAQGLYLPAGTGPSDRTSTFALPDGVSVFGGFAGTETSLEQRSYSDHRSILSGDLNGDDDIDNDGNLLNTSENVYHVVIGAPDALLDGFTIRSGNANGASASQWTGGGLFADHANGLQLANLTVELNQASIGGAVYTNAALAVSNCVFSRNFAGMTGGAIYTENSDLTIDGALFERNHAIWFGGGLMGFGSGGTMNLTNVTFHANQADDTGGAIRTNFIELHLNHVTMLDNTAQADKGPALFNSQAVVTIENSILWGSDTPIREGDPANYPVSVVRSVVQGGHAGDGNRSGDPLLADLKAYGGDVHTLALLPGSAAIDISDQNCAAADARAISRPGPQCDAGAFESQGFNMLKLDPGNSPIPQGAMINTAFLDALAVRVTANNPVEPVDGGLVTFTPPASGPSAALSTTRAAINSGLASVTANANAKTGHSYLVNVTCAGAPDTFFALINNLFFRYRFFLPTSFSR